MNQLELKPKPITLADVISTLIQTHSPIVTVLSSSAFKEYQTQGDHIDYTFVSLQLNPNSVTPANPSTHLYAGFVDNGYLPFDPNQDMTQYPIQKIDFFQNIQCEGLSLENVPITFNTNSTVDNWTYEFNLETIFEAYGLDNGPDVASFVGFFLITPTDET